MTSATMAMAAVSGRLPLVLRVAGIVLLLAGLQAWGFHRHIVPLLATADEQLSALQLEASDNRLMNDSLQSLQAFWRTASDDLARRQALELRDAVIEKFAAEPAAAVAEFARAIDGLDGGDADNPEAVAELRRQSLRLERMYADHYAAAIDAVSRPPWYLQPTAALLNNDATRRRSLDLNRASYLMLIRDPPGAIEILDALRSERSDDAVTAMALYGLARVHIDAFRVSKDSAHFDDALRYARQSVITDADHELGKLFLDYLVSVDRQAVEVDAESLEGEGSGEAEGERGAISAQPEDF